MPRTTKSTPMQVRLSIEDQKRLTAMSKELGRPKSELGREAIRYYLDNYDRVESDKRESQLVQAINNMANRVCAMLNRQGTDIGTLYEIAYQTMPEKDFFVGCLNKTKERLRKRQTDDERKLSERMASLVTQGVEEAIEASKTPQKSKKKK